ncbi:MAG: uracil-DNA glycosylase [Kiloniellaceae bacterium]
MPAPEAFPDPERALLDALKWQIEAGADEAIGERPLDRTAAAAKPAPAPPARASVPSGGLSEPAARPSPAPPAEAAAAPVSRPAAALTSPGEAQASAQRLAATAKSIAEIRAALEIFEGCPLKATATNLCLYDGNPEARIMIVGEAPGAQEDRQGKPFVGPAGQLLDRMLAAIGLDRSKVYITNLLYWRPPGNRNPTPGEIASCLPFLERQVEILQPKLLLLVGGMSAKTLLNRSEGILKLRGRWADYHHPRLEHPIPALPTLHPAYLLRQPAQKREAWRDLLSFAEAMEREGLSPAPPGDAPAGRSIVPQ